MLARFGRFAWDGYRQELRHDGRVVALQAQPARLLGMLIARSGETVSREAIQRQLWADRTVAYDQSINYCIRQIRRALDEAGGDAGWVQTVPRMGYRFVGAIEPDRPVGRSWSPRAAATLVLAALAVGSAIGYDLRAPVRLPAHSTAHTIDPTVAADWVRGTWRFVVLHVTGEAHCPVVARFTRYLALLRENS